MSRLLRFFPCCLLVGLLSGLLSADARAQSPEPLPAYTDAMPAYAQAGALREDASLHAVAFGGSDAGRAVGIACGDRGTILRSEDGGQTWVVRESNVECRLGDVAWIGPQRVVVAGGGYDRITRISRGVVLYSDDAGRSWRRAADEELPRFRSLQVQQDGSLLATNDWSHSLLTRQTESHDGGRTWQAAGEFETQVTSSQPPERGPSTSSQLTRWVRATRAPVAIRDACRIDDSAVCAVGDHGVILRSTDRGTTWQSARGQQRHASILVVADHPPSVPWSLLGSESLENRNRVALLLREAGEGDQASAIELAAQVAVMLGGSGADRITADGSSISRAAVEWIDIHRPAVVVMDESLPAEVHQAFFQAATSAGVARIVTYALDGTGSIALHRDALLPKAGALASDLFADALHYVAPLRRGSSSVSLRYLYDAAPQARRSDTVVGGLRLEQSQQLAGPISQASRRQLQIVQARLKQSQRIADMVSSARSPDQFSRILRLTLDQTAAADRFRVAWAVLLEAESSSRGTEFGQLVLEQVAERFPQTSAGRWAGLRIESIRNSLEWQRLRSSLAAIQVEAPATPAAETVSVSPFQDLTSGVKQVSAISPVVVPKPETHNLTRQGVKKVEVDLTWEFHPIVLIAREAARHRGDHGQLQLTGGQSANLKRLAESEGPWSRLLGTAGPRVIMARRARVQPKLDGILDDACWQSALSSAGRSTRLRVAYDDDYVYVATQCRADQLAADRGSRSGSVRDHDLSDVDRMQLLIDIDRDLMTSMQLQVSDAGRTHDAIDRDPAWQPTWYVDTRRGDDQVTVEIAILRRDLVDLPITAGESWFMSALPVPGGSDRHDPLVPNPNDWSRVVFQK